MENAQRCRAMALLCRQQAVLHPDQKWKWLGQAERWNTWPKRRTSAKSKPGETAPQPDLRFKRSTPANDPHRSVSLIPMLSY